MSTKVEMIGQRFGKLTVIAESPIRKNKCVYWICKCDCGSITKPIKGANLRDGTTKSCGCLITEAVITRCTVHGLSHSRLHMTWDNMIQRCTNPKRPEYKNYGGRGITICVEWRNSFQAFYDWAMANGYSEGLSIDRIDVNGNYEPSNCRWATMKQQQNNRRNSILIEDGGQLKTIQQLSVEKGVDASTIYRRWKKGKDTNNERTEGS